MKQELVLRGFWMKEIRPDYYKSNGVETIDVIEAFDLNFYLKREFERVENERLQLKN